MREDIKKNVEINNENYEEIFNFALGSSSRTDLLKKLGWGKNAYQLNKLDDLLLKKEFNFELFSKNKKITMTSIFNDKNKLTEIVKKSHSYAGVFREYKRKVSSSSFKILKKYIEIYEIDCSHFNNKDKYLDPKFKTYQTNEELFVQNSTVDRITIRRRILKDILIEYKCNGKGCCIQREWLGNKISLQLEHINGNGQDNRLENLEFLCPNCHSITKTWGARNIKSKTKKINSVFVKKLEIDVENLIINVLPKCKNKKEVLDYYKLSNHSRNHQGLKLILERYSKEKTVIEFLEK